MYRNQQQWHKQQKNKKKNFFITTLTYAEKETTKTIRQHIRTRQIETQRVSNCSHLIHFHISFLLLLSHSRPHSFRTKSKLLTILNKFVRTTARMCAYVVVLWLIWLMADRARQGVRQDINICVEKFQYKSSALDIRGLLPPPQPIASWLLRWMPSSRELLMTGLYVARMPVKHRNRDRFGELYEIRSDVGYSFA